MHECHKQGPNIKAEPTSDLSIKPEPPKDCSATYVISKAEENPVSNDQLTNATEPVSAKPNLGELSNISLCIRTSNISPEICAKSSFTNITDQVSPKLEQENTWVISIINKEEREDIQVMLNDDQNVSRNKLQVMIKDSDIKVEPESSGSHIDDSIVTCQYPEVIHTTVKSDIENLLDQKVSYPTSHDSAALSSISPLAHSLKSNPDNVDSTLVESAPSAVALSAPASLTPSTPVPVSQVQSTTVSPPSPLTQVPSSTLLPRPSTADEQPMASDSNRSDKSTVLVDPEGTQDSNGYLILEALPKHDEQERQKHKSSFKTLARLTTVEQPDAYESEEDEVSNCTVELTHDEVDESGFEEGRQSIDVAMQQPEQAVDDSNLRSYKCEICKKTFTTMSVLKLHQKLYHKFNHQKKVELVSSKKIEPIPNKKIEPVPDKKIELSTVPNKTIEPVPKQKIEADPPCYLYGYLIPSDFKCDVCGEIHKGKKKYQRHRKTHLIQCKFCDKRFHKRYLLENHMRLHTGEKPFLCDICGTKFYTNVHLSQHNQRHHSAKKFQCQICGKYYQDRRGVVRHTKTHAGIKPFHCEVCGKQFTQAGSVKLHMRIHADTEEGRKPFQCTICNKRFGQAGSYRSHLKMHDNVDS